ncbi:unnamed protein product [Oppiella nova]|uniref:G-protein coupled receptors family 1 profile domain-containing protein n=1 Tax=Oppiella nova TaxID=334625 RepID=A0A7R9M6V4_9ACAR|nr:unnamed protein product [Oppiella nova]CAG2171890.1 unnamed protein product [Oppiella nova]
MLLDDWPFGTLVCKLGPFIQAMSVYVSTISMTIIAIDRYQVLVGLLRRRLTTTVPTGLIIAVIWVTAGLLSIPHAYFNQIVEMFTFKKLIRCRAVYPEPDDKYRKWITVLTFSTQYSIPLLIISVCYARIGVHIWQRVGIGAMTQQQRTDQNQSKRKTIKMLITVVVVFAICWLPLNIHHIMADFGFWNYSSNVFLICHWIAMSSVCYNPFIYFWLNKHYNERAKYLLKICFTLNCHRKQPPDVTQDSVNTQNERKTSAIGSHRSKLKRSNAMKASKNKYGNGLFGVMCVRSSISTTDSMNDNNFMNSVDNGNNGNGANQTVIIAIVEESKL